MGCSCSSKVRLPGLIQSDVSLKAVYMKTILDNIKPPGSEIPRLWGCIALCLVSDINSERYLAIFTLLY